MGPMRVADLRTYHIDLNPTSLRGSATAQQRGPFAAQAGALLVEVTTDEGLTGWGLGGGGLASALIIERHLKQFVLGRDPRHAEAIWDDLYFHTQTYGRRGLPIMAISGIDLALWDLAGKAAGKPVYALVTDKPRTRFFAYATQGDFRLAVEQGFRGVKLSIPYGVKDGQKGFDANLRLVRETREQIGPEVELMTDVYLKWDVEYTLRFARAARDVELKWIEEPIPVDDYDGMARLCREVRDTLIVSGEHEFTRYGFRELLRHKASKILQPDISWAGGFSECRKIAALGAREGVPTWPHQGGTPWGLHLIATLPLPAWAETWGPSVRPPQSELFRQLRPPAVRGEFIVSDKPGFGVDLTRELVERYTIDRL
jgi:L-rhamnonate dehydratase